MLEHLDGDVVERSLAMREASCGLLGVLWVSNFGRLFGGRWQGPIAKATGGLPDSWLAAHRLAGLGRTLRERPGLRASSFLLCRPSADIGLGP